MRPRCAAARERDPGARPQWPPTSLRPPMQTPTDKAVASGASLLRPAAHTPSGKAVASGASLLCTLIRLSDPPPDRRVRHAALSQRDPPSLRSSLPYDRLLSFGPVASPATPTNPALYSSRPLLLRSFCPSGPRRFRRPGVFFVGTQAAAGSHPVLLWAATLPFLPPLRPPTLPASGAFFRERAGSCRNAVCAPGDGHTSIPSALRPSAHFWRLGVFFRRHAASRRNPSCVTQGRRASVPFAPSTPGTSCVRGCFSQVHRPKSNPILCHSGLSLRPFSSASFRCPAVFLRRRPDRPRRDAGWMPSALPFNYRNGPL